MTINGGNAVLVAVGLWIGSEYRRDMSESEAIQSLRSFLATAESIAPLAQIAEAVMR